MLSDKLICVFGDDPLFLRVKVFFRRVCAAGGFFMSKSLKEASFLGATFLVGLAALEAMLHLAGF